MLRLGKKRRHTFSASSSSYEKLSLMAEELMYKKRGLEKRSDVKIVSSVVFQGTSRKFIYFPKSLFPVDVVSVWLCERKKVIVLFWMAKHVPL